MFFETKLYFKIVDGWIRLSQQKAELGKMGVKQQLEENRSA